MKSALITGSSIKDPDKFSAQFSAYRFRTIILGAFLTLVSALAADAQTPARKPNPAEAWVVEQLKAGKLADLSEKFPNKEDRKLGAQFLEDLLTGSKPHRNGVRILWAVIDEMVDLANAQVLSEVWLANCEFNGTALLRRANFTGAVSFNDTTFKRSAHFNSMKVGNTAFFRNTVFEGTVSFGAAEITSNFEATGAQFRHKDLQANFNSMKVGYDARFENAVFEGPVNFGAIHITGNLEMKKTRFNSKQKEAVFNGIKVGYDAIFENAIFEGPANFGTADIANDFDAEETHFKNKEQEANFNGIKIGRIGRFQKAVFEGPVDFSNVEIGFFAAQEAHFNNREQKANFNSMKVRRNAHFERAVFEGPVSFALVDVASTFDADDAHFSNTEQGANFSGVKIGRIFFDMAIFEGPVDFVGAHIAEDFHADGVQFKNQGHKANFNSMKVGHHLFLRKACFEGPVDFVAVHIANNFEAIGARFNYRPAMSDKVAGANLRVPEGSSANEKEEVSFNAMKVLGATFFNDAVFEGPVDLRYADFAGLNVSNVSWPKKAGSLDMTGMTYKYIRAVTNNEPQSHDVILKLIEQSVYSADVYRNLETFFFRQGYRAHADKAFIAGKRRERKEHLSKIPYVGSLALDLLVGYGRRAWQIAIPCALLVGFGVALFSPNKMEPQKIDTTPRVYNRFWYSIGLFLPIVNLESDKVWKPKPEQTFLRNYMRVHILLGWILIPILVAALTGLIK